ncbi:MAG: hypothetical protein RL026_2548 [Pseudomonadota bacterium]
MGEARQIRAVIRYVVKGEKAIFYAAERERSYWPPDDHEMTITDARALDEPLTVARNGFALLRHRTAVTDFQDPTQITDVFAPEACELARQINGASKVISFGPVARTDDPASRPGALPAVGAHVDYGRRTIEDQARQILGDEADHWLAKRVVLMNFWRPITPVFSSPLALCDASTVAADDLNDSEIRGGLMDANRKPLYGFNLSYNPAHRWYYAPRMQPDEMFAFKLYDSDSSRPQWTGHTAITDPDTPAGAPPRQSMEIRTISFID